MSRRSLVDNDPNRDNGAFAEEFPTVAFDDAKENATAFDPAYLPEERCVIPKSVGTFSTVVEEFIEVESDVVPAIVAEEGPNGVGAVFDIGGNPEDDVMIPL